MTELIQKFLEYGSMGLFAGTMFWLYLRERKRNEDYQSAEHKRQKEALDIVVGNTATYGTLTRAMEDLAAAIEAQGEQTQEDMVGCQTNVQQLLHRLDEYIKERELEQARDEGRKEVTGRFRMPIGVDDE